MNFRQIAYKLSLRYRNSSQYPTSNVLYSVLWGDGTPDNTLVPVQSDLTGAPNPTFINGLDPAFGGNASNYFNIKANA